jgi:aminoacrylate hydrolase
MSADLVAIMHADGIVTAHYLGHSTGGAIGVATALDYPGRFRSMMIFASTTCGDPYRRKLLGLRQHLLENLGGEAYAQYRSLLLYPPYYINANHEKLAAEEARDASLLGEPHVQASRLNAILAFDRRSELHTLRLPVMVLCANDDVLTPRYFSEEYARLIPGATTRWIERGGHAYSRTEPAEFNQIALDYFTQVNA